MIHKDTYFDILNQIGTKTRLIAVSKTKPIEDIKALYELGHRDFGENKVQELIEKHVLLPKDIRWHLIGHLQTNKVKLVLPFVFMIHSVDSEKLMQVIEKNAKELHLTNIRCLLQLHIAKEENKTGFDVNVFHTNFMDAVKKCPSIQFCGLMGIATNTIVEAEIVKEFSLIQNTFLNLQKSFGESFSELSIGMSDDYKIAIEHGSTYIRVGSLLFGDRNYG